MDKPKVTIVYVGGLRQELNDIESHWFIDIYSKWFVDEGDDYISIQRDVGMGTYEINMRNVLFIEYNEGDEE